MIKESKFNLKTVSYKWSIYHSCQYIMRKIVSLAEAHFVIEQTNWHTVAHKVTEKAAKLILS